MTIILSSRLPTARRGENATIFAAPQAISSDESDRDPNLQAEADALLPLFDNMMPVAVYVTDAPVVRSGTSSEHRVAYTNCERREFPSIYVKKAFYQKNNRTQIINVLKHELTHAWFCRQRIAAGHDDRFRQKFRQVGGWGN